MSNYKITKYSYDRAKQLGVMIKRSTNPKKKIDVFSMDGDKLASIGAVGYNDFPTFIKKIGRAEALKKRRLYRGRHAHEPKWKDGKRTPSYYADEILW